MNEVIVEVWGDFACFTRPESKVERLTYPVMTPSAARGILSAIYSKPVEFYWQVRKIEVLNPVKYISFQRNEVKQKMGKQNKDGSFEPIIVEEVNPVKENGKKGDDKKGRTQRQSVVLKNVRYRITAEIVKRENFEGTTEQLYRQAMRRIENGKCFFQPSLGTREFVCYFGEPTDIEPIKEDMDLGLMLYDVFDLHKFKVTKKAEPYVTLFKANMVQGVIEVPEFDSELVLKPERGE